MLWTIVWRPGLSLVDGDGHGESGMGFEVALDIRAELGESPVWSRQDGVLYFIDISGRRLHSFEPASGVHVAASVPEDIGCIGLRPGGGFVAGLRSGLWLLDRNGKLERKLADNPEDNASSRFNDGKIDPAGRMVLGTIDEKRVGGLANLYHYSDSDLRVLVPGITVSNGIAFSPDGQTLYYADSPKSTVWKCPYDPSTGRIGPSAVFLRTESDEGRPDGAAVDSEGCYWIALFNGGRIRRYDPDGTMMEEHFLPARCPTMIAFGGGDLRTLYVTTARVGRSEAELVKFPHSGSLFSMPVPVSGLPATLFDERS